MIGIAQTRLELLSTELQEEVHRVAEIMVWATIALLAAGVGLFLLALVVIFVFWDTHRVLASIAVTSVFFLIAVVAGLVLRAKLRSKPPLLDATLAELKKDRESLLSKGEVGASMSDRVKELVERELQLASSAARRSARSIACEMAAIEERFVAVDRMAGLARSTLLHPAVIAGGIVALLTIGRLRGMRLVGRLYLLATAARRLVQIVRVLPRGRRVEDKPEWRGGV